MKRIVIAAALTGALTGCQFNAKLEIVARSPDVVLFHLKPEQGQSFHPCVDTLSVSHYNQDGQKVFDWGFSMRSNQPCISDVTYGLMPANAMIDYPMRPLRPGVPYMVELTGFQFPGLGGSFELK